MSTLEEMVAKTFGSSFGAYGNRSCSVTPTECSYNQKLERVNRPTFLMVGALDVLEAGEGIKLFRS